MTLLKKEEILHVAKLAKIELTDSEIDRFTPQLTNILNFISELSEVDTVDSEPTSQTTGLENIKREDSVIGNESLTQDQALSGINKIYNGYFKVEAILEGRSDK